jgi:anti-sigma B factor antagonist
MFVKFSFLQVEPGVTVMDFTGRLSMPGILVAEVELTIKKQIERGAKKLVLDVSKVDFLDSSGVGMLAVCSGAMKEAAGTMVIAGASGIVKKGSGDRRSAAHHGNVSRPCFGLCRLGRAAFRAGAAGLNASPERLRRALNRTFFRAGR